MIGCNWEPEADEADGGVLEPLGSWGGIIPQPIGRQGRTVGSKSCQAASTESQFNSFWSSEG